MFDFVEDDCVAAIGSDDTFGASFFFLVSLTLDSMDTLVVESELEDGNREVLESSRLFRAFVLSESSIRSPRRPLSRSKLRPGRYDLILDAEGWKNSEILLSLRGGPSILP